MGPRPRRDRAATIGNRARYSARLDQRLDIVADEAGMQREVPVRSGERRRDAGQAAPYPDLERRSVADQFGDECADPGRSVRDRDRRVVHRAARGVNDDVRLAHRHVRGVE